MAEVIRKTGDAKVEDTKRSKRSRSTSRSSRRSRSKAGYNAVSSRPSPRGGLLELVLALELDVGAAALELVELVGRLVGRRPRGVVVAADDEGECHAEPRVELEVAVEEPRAGIRRVELPDHEAVRREERHVGARRVDEVELHGGRVVDVGLAAVDGRDEVGAPRVEEAGADARARGVLCVELQRDAVLDGRVGARGAVVAEDVGVVDRLAM
mmetsp:Transcript_21429/g.85237  ORF Transcript_21429/g.85237 Transcript_21429/m.85237 type:complete len:212 (+) Transcript_21429:59-694(+)